MTYGCCVMISMFQLFDRFRRDEGGAFAIMFGLMALVIIALGGAVVDYVSLEQTRSRAQIALDAAALALQPEIMTATEDSIKARAKALLLNRIGDADVTADVTAIKVDKVAGSLYLEARMQMPTIFVALVGVNNLGAKIVSETTRGSLNVEVAVAVDVTGSMNETISTSGGSGSRTKMAALKDALNSLIDIVVQDTQKPTYSKMAIVPYSAAVNVGSYADTIRGPIRQPTAITAVSWASSVARTITTATNANPVEITTAVAHGFAVGDYVYVSGISTMTLANNQILRVRAVSSTTKFTLNNVNGTSFSGTSSSKSGTGGTVTRCTLSTCDIVVTSNLHGLANGDNVYITGAKGMVTYGDSGSTSSTWFNNNPNGDGTATANGTFLVWQIANVTPNSFSLVSTAARNSGTYTSGGTVSCVTAGCSQFFFRNGSSADRRHVVTSCVSERTVNPFNDASPQTTLIGRNYASVNNPCLPNTIVPLTSTKKTLHDLANGLTAVGSTAGHLGVGWAWYMVSPNFKGPWPTASQPAAASTPNVLRAVVLMTDGDFNTAYCDGVISNNTSTSGSGDAKNKINCTAANGSAFTQAEKLCTEMKRVGIRVYTVGLDVADLAAAKQIMANCATDASHAYEATTSADLAAVFADIGRKLSFLRVTK